MVDANSTKSASELKETIFKELCQLTTHINSDDYDETLKKLEHLNVDFLNPDAVNTCIASNFKTCKAVKKESNTFKVLLIINLFLPYLLWKKVFQPKINEIEFTSTFRFAIAISVVPIFLVLIMVLLSLTIGVKFAIMYLLNVLVLTLLAVKL